jgi:hypothetical protein
MCVHPLGRCNWATHTPHGFCITMRESIAERGGGIGLERIAAIVWSEFVAGPRPSIDERLYPVLSRYLDGVPKATARLRKVWAGRDGIFVHPSPPPIVVVVRMASRTAVAKAAQAERRAR